jgi:uncharacterized protein (DUF302 family)
MRYLIASLLSLLLLACQPQGAQTANNELITKTSPYGVTQTMDRLQEAVLAKGATVFARVNHAAGAQKIGQSLAAEEVLIFGNPKLGTPLMQTDPRIGLDLPVKVLVWDDKGTTKIAFLDPAKLGAWYGIAPDHPALIKMRGVLEAVTKSATASP